MAGSRLSRTEHLREEGQVSQRTSGFIHLTVYGGRWGSDDLVLIDLLPPFPQVSRASSNMFDRMADVLLGGR